MSDRSSSENELWLAQAARIAREVRQRVDSTNRWIAAFFFLLIVTWLNVAVDLSAGERGLPSKRVVDATDAASAAFQVCQKGLEKECEDKKENLEESLLALNDDVDFVVFRIKNLDIVYQPILVVLISLFLIVYISWSRAIVTDKIVRMVDISKNKIGNVEPPPDLIVSSTPIWLWPLGGRDEGRVNRTDLVAYLDVTHDSKWPIQAYIMVLLTIFLLLMVAHTVWIHSRIAFRTVGAEFSRMSFGESWGTLEQYKGELPHSMAFTGWGLLDLIIMIGGFAGVFAVIDLAFQMKKSASGDNSLTRPLWQGVSRRTALVTAIVASVVAFDAVRGSTQQALKRIGFARVPRFRRHKRQLQNLGLSEGVYENKGLEPKDTAHAVIGHFVRRNGTARGIYDMVVSPVRQVPYQLTSDNIESSNKRLNRSARSEATEWAALRAITESNDPQAALQILIKELELSSGLNGRINMRLFDLAAGLAIRKRQEWALTRIRALAQSVRANISGRQNLLLEKRISTWSNPKSKWAERWKSDKRVKWNGIDI